MINDKKIEEAVKLFIEGIGEDINREGLKDTPKRISAMCHELFEGMDGDAAEHLGKTFTAENNQMVIEKDISFYSICEHHFLPFYGKAAIAYVPDGKVAGLSKLARCVEVFARRAQIQEQMTYDIADAIMKYLKPQGVMVLIEAEHLCMTMRGIKKPGSKTISYAAKGSFETDERLRDTFFKLI